MAKAKCTRCDTEFEYKSSPPPNNCGCSIKNKRKTPSTSDPGENQEEKKARAIKAQDESAPNNAKPNLSDQEWLRLNERIFTKSETCTFKTRSFARPICLIARIVVSGKPKNRFTPPPPVSFLNAEGLKKSWPSAKESTPVPLCLKEMIPDRSLLEACTANLWDQNLYESPKGETAPSTKKEEDGSSTPSITIPTGRGQEKVAASSPVGKVEADQDADLSDKASGAAEEKAQCEIIDLAEADLLTNFDKGHIIAIALGGLDHSFQVLPQVRMCNRGTWLRMENRIAVREWKVDAKTWIKKQKPSSETTGALSLSLIEPQTLNSQSALYARVFPFYVDQHDPRIPVWLYLQLYCRVGETLVGVAQFSIANGLDVTGQTASELEIAEFIKAHEALKLPYPKNEVGQAQFALGEDHPNPPYIALQWLHDKQSVCMPPVTFSADPFKGGQIAIIRKYNRWLNGKLLSDHCAAVRKALIKQKEREYKIFDSLVNLETFHADGDSEVNRFVEANITKAENRLKDLRPPENKICVGVDGVDGIDGVDGVDVSPQEFYFEATDGTLSSDPEVLNKIAEKLNKLSSNYHGKRKFKPISVSIAEAENWAQRLTKSRDLKAEISAYRNALARKALNVSEIAEMKKRADLAKYIFNDLSMENPDVYEELSESGGRSYPEVDHVTPKGRGGENRYDNARLISFAQNHIYRDKTYLSAGMTADKKEDALKCCARNHAKEVKRSQEHTGIDRRHAEAVRDFANNPNRDLIGLIKGFISKWGVPLDDYSDRPAPVVTASEGAASSPMDVENTEHL